MSFSNRFHLFVASTTIAAAYWVSTHVTIATDTLGDLAPFAKLAGAYLGSAALYQLLATLLRWLFNHVRILRKIVLENEFLEGTWIRAYGQRPEKRFTVEHFEQTVDGLVIRGYAFSEDAQLQAQWNSRSVSINASAGTLMYSYDCDVIGSKTSHEGIAFFNLERKGTRTAAHGMIGYSADLVDGTRTTNIESKLSDKQIDVVQARHAAMKHP